MRSFSPEQTPPSSPQGFLFIFHPPYAQRGPLFTFTAHIMHYNIAGRVSIALASKWVASGEAVFLRVYDGILPAAVIGSGAHGDMQLNAALLDEISIMPMAREPLDEEGCIQVMIDDRQHAYAGGPLSMVLEITCLPPMHNLELPFPPIFQCVQVWEPQWQREGNSHTMRWDFEVPTSILEQWMAYFGVYCYQGSLLSESDASPISGALIEACLHEKQMPHLLGSDMTRPNGAFEIWMRMALKGELADDLALGNRLDFAEKGFQLQATRANESAAFEKWVVTPFHLRKGAIHAMRLDLRAGTATPKIASTSLESHEAEDPEAAPASCCHGWPQAQSAFGFPAGHVQLEQMQATRTT
jgi:hypothetical protein